MKHALQIFLAAWFLAASCFCHGMMPPTAAQRALGIVKAVDEMKDYYQEYTLQTTLVGLQKVLKTLADNWETLEKEPNFASQLQEVQQTLSSTHSSVFKAPLNEGRQILYFYHMLSVELGNQLRLIDVKQYLVFVKNISTEWKNIIDTVFVPDLEQAIQTAEQQRGDDLYLRTLRQHLRAAMPTSIKLETFIQAIKAWHRNTLVNNMNVPKSTQLGTILGADYAAYLGYDPSKTINDVTPQAEEDKKLTETWFAFVQNNIMWAVATHISPEIAAQCGTSQEELVDILAPAFKAERTSDLSILFGQLQKEKLAQLREIACQMAKNEIARANPAEVWQQKEEEKEAREREQEQQKERLLTAKEPALARLQKAAILCTNFSELAQQNQIALKKLFQKLPPELNYNVKATQWLVNQINQLSNQVPDCYNAQRLGQLNEMIEKIRELLVDLTLGACRIATLAATPQVTLNTVLVQRHVDICIARFNQAFTRCGDNFQERWPEEQIYLATYWNLINTAHQILSLAAQPNVDAQVTATHISKFSQARDGLSRPRFAPFAEYVRPILLNENTLSEFLKEGKRLARFYTEQSERQAQMQSFFLLLAWETIEASKLILEVDAKKRAATDKDLMDLLLAYGMMTSTLPIETTFSAPNIEIDRATSYMISAVHACQNYLSYKGANTQTIREICSGMLDGEVEMASIMTQRQSIDMNKPYFISWMVEIRRLVELLSAQKAQPKIGPAKMSELKARMLLNIDPGATLDSTLINQQYKKASTKFHPDKTKDMEEAKRKQAEEICKELPDARDVLLSKVPATTTTTTKQIPATTGGGDVD